MKEKVIQPLKIVGIGAVWAGVLALTVSTKAQCTGSFESLMSAISVSRGQSKPTKKPADNLLTPQTDQLSDKGVNTSIVGLWRIKFIIDTPNGPAVFQEAYQIWNTGGTEVHNPKVDPRGGSVCLGSWVQDPALNYQLTHRVWLYDTAGNFQVIGRLTENLTLGDRGTTHSGSFELQALDDNENPMGPPLNGHVTGVV